MEKEKEKRKRKLAKFKSVRSTRGKGIESSVFPPQTRGVRKVVFFIASSEVVEKIFLCTAQIRL
jgi:hypothetical protein